MDRPMKKKYAVLVVDDQENWRNLLVELLKDEFEVFSAVSYDAALQKIRSRNEPFHVLVTDMRLVDEEAGNASGLDLAAEINRQGGGTKVVVVTGYPTLRTIKRAFGVLNVYDYLEKRPSDGSPFNVSEFLRLVREAAQVAERSRPNGLTKINNRVLLLTSDPLLQERMEQILRNQYEATALVYSDDVIQRVASLKQLFAIIVLDENAGRNTDLMNALQEIQPQARQILLTSQEHDVLRILNEYPIAKAIPVPKSEAERLRILDDVRKVLNTTKYVILEIETPEGKRKALSENMQLNPGVSYAFALRMQDLPDRYAFPVSLEPLKNKKQDIVLDVFIGGQQLKIMPSGWLSWRVAQSVDFQVVFRGVGGRKMVLELRQGYRLAGKKEITFQITS